MFPQNSLFYSYDILILLIEGASSVLEVVNSEKLQEVAESVGVAVGAFSTAFSSFDLLKEPF